MTTASQNLGGVGARNLARLHGDTSGSTTSASTSAATRALGRLPAGEMNKTEAAYSAALEARRAAGEVLWFAFEPLTLKLAKDTRLTVDFMVMRADQSIEFHDVKGNWFQDDAKVKVKVAAALFPMFRFLVVRKQTQKQGGGWSEEQF